MAQTCGEQRKILNSPFTLVTLEYIKRKKCVLVTNYPSLPYRGQLHIWLLASGVEKEWLGWTSDAGGGSCYIRRWSLCQLRSLSLAIVFFFISLRGGRGAYSEAGKKGVMGRDSPLALCAHFHHPLANILAFLDPNRTEKWQFCSEPVNRLPVPLASQPDFSVKWNWSVTANLQLLLIEDEVTLQQHKWISTM